MKTSPGPNAITRRRALRSLLMLPAGVVAGCGLGTSADGPDGLRMLIPNVPGGGYDLTARAMARVLEADDLAGPIDKFNVVGGGGSVALARLMREVGNEELLAMAGVGVVGAGLVNDSPWRLSDATPLARVVDEPGSIVVRSDSAFATVGDFVSEWSGRPEEFVIGAGSSIGGPDHVLALETAQAAAMNPATVSIVAYDGAGDLLTALLDGSVDAGFAGSGEYLDRIAAGSLRMLAISRFGGVATQHVPTLRESGVDVDFTNWRGFFAPPGISEDGRLGLIDVLSRAHDSAEWMATVDDHGWIDSFSTGHEFAEFLVYEDIRVSRALTELGVAE